MKTQPLLAPAILCGAMLTFPAFASTVTVVTTVNANNIQPGQNGFTGGVQDVPPFYPAFSVTLAEGDTFDLTIKFEECQVLNIDQLNFFWIFSYISPGSPDSDFDGTGTVSFLDSAGATVFTSAERTDTEGGAHFGQFFLHPGELDGRPDLLSFSAARYVGKVNDYLADGITVRTYNSPALYFNAASFSVTSTSCPDAASSLTLLPLGLACLVFAARRTRQALDFGMTASRA